MDLFASFNFTLLETSIVDGFSFIIQPAFVLGLFIGVLLLLLTLSRLGSPYVKVVSEFLFTAFLASILICAILYSSYRVGCLLLFALVVVLILCFFERLWLAIRTRSVAPFVDSSDTFATFDVATQHYVFPMYSTKNILVILTTAEGVSCNGVCYKGSIAMTDRGVIVSHFSRRDVLLDRVEHGYDYTVFTYVDSTIVDNTPRVTPIKFEADV
ncbi:nonstructural protein 3 [Pteropus rufus nobecovirus]|nr:nonstructural protein 3 [Pteropus rufus nobecovirus]